MKRLLIVFLLISTLVIGTTSLIAADDVEELFPLEPQAAVEAGDIYSESVSGYFIEFNSRPVADGGNPNRMNLERATFRAAAREDGVVYNERYSFNTLWNGLSVMAGPTEASQFRNMPGVKAVYPIVDIEIPETISEPDMAYALSMTGADIAQKELGYTGKGIKVGIMDTGVDYDHPDLGGCFGPGCRVDIGWDFVGDDYDANPGNPTYNPVPSPDPYPDDCNGHGTHVAGIVGANGEVVGVAPDVTFGAYRVFGCAGSTESDIMIAAMERAYRDGMDVLNMSIGSAFMTWPQYPTAAAADLLVKRGMVIVASIGNSGANGIYSAGAPGVGNRVIGVASFDNTTVDMNYFTVTPADVKAGYNQATGAPAAPTSGSLPLAKTGTPTTVDDGCAPHAAGAYKGMAVLIRRGTCSFYEKAKFAQDAGAAAVVIYNNVPGRINPTVAGDPPITIPVVSVSDVEGKAISDALDAGPQTLNWQDDMQPFENATGGLISAFSSFGMTAELVVKPDIGAPGGQIMSTWPLEDGGYAAISGTSMASPHVAGGVALLLEARPKLTPKEVRDVLLNSADPAVWSGNPGLGLLDHVHRQGAGLIDIDDAILSTTTISPSKLSLGESDAGRFVRRLYVRNTSRTSVTYDVSHVPVVSTGPNSNALTYYLGVADVKFSKETITVPRNGSRSVAVRITAPTGIPDGSLYGGYVVFTPRDGGQAYSVPFAGYKGDYQDIKVMTPSTAGFPLVGRATSCFRVIGTECIAGTFALTQPGHKFTMTDIYNMPSFLVHFEHQARVVEMSILKSNGQPVHREFSKFVDIDYWVRNSTATGFYAFTWDGTRLQNNNPNGPTRMVPDGDYYIEIRVLKPLGLRSNPNHWETWRSPLVTIDRP